MRRIATIRMRINTSPLHMHRDFFKDPEDNSPQNYNEFEAVKHDAVIDNSRLPKVQHKHT